MSPTDATFGPPIVKNANGVVLVATLNDTIIGFASAVGGVLRTICVESPYRRQGVGDALEEMKAFDSVDRACRRQGIGSALLRAVARECEQRGATSMFAGYTSGEFYEANGWRVQREFVEMRRQL